MSVSSRMKVIPQPDITLRYYGEWLAANLR